MSDQKIKTAAGKVPLNLVPLSALKGAARVFGYGARKYAAGNYYTADDEALCNRYAGGMLRHLSDAQLPNGLFDFSSLASSDVESGLPEIDHMLCGLIMLRALLTKHGALPADPGWGNEPPAKDEPTIAEVARAHDEVIVAARVAAGAFDVLPPKEIAVGSRVRVLSNTDTTGHQTGAVGTVTAGDHEPPEWKVTFDHEDASGDTWGWLFARELEVV